MPRKSGKPGLYLSTSDTRAGCRIREVRLPQGLRFTDVRRSTIGGLPMARHQSRAAKSSGCPELCHISCLLRALRLLSAASFCCARLRSLLAELSDPHKSFLCSLR